ncbi:MAG TPA: glucose-1-phosphate adenylyltransferase subunit GlgD [Clostridiales bacterium]|jgi:glucose-1-phosphate adenylyltransferase|nr:glucose-1-phosphate adenylyltransferase subunit GlgD [Clostridiales bacterium]
MKVLGIIFSYSTRENLRELTKRRTLASLPVGAKYRIIDFPLSNMANHGIHEISVICRNNYHSLIDHLSAGKEWDLERKRGGLRVLTPYDRMAGNEPVLYRGMIEGLANNMDSLHRSRADYVILSGTSVIYNVDFKELLRNHIASGADITAVYADNYNGSHFVPNGSPIYHLDDDDRLADLTINPEESEQPNTRWGIDLIVMRKYLMESLVADAIAFGRYDFDLDILKRLAGSLYIKGVRYEGHLLEISNVPGYMKANMKLLDSEFRARVFRDPVYTKHKDSVPTRYFEGCHIRNSMISEGCRINGVVENSLISREVKIGRGAVIRNSIIMQNTEIMNDVLLDNVIIDKDVIVREHRSLAGHSTYPVVVEKGSIV